MDQTFRDIACGLVAISRSFYARGWALGTSGNFSAVLSREPLRLAITPSGADKGELAAEQIVETGWGMDDADNLKGKPSAEALLHINVVLERGAGAVLHTHSVWSTIVSNIHVRAGGIIIEGFEMLKGLEGVKSHEHREWLPIIENSQDMPVLAQNVSWILKRVSRYTRVSLETARTLHVGCKSCSGETACRDFRISAGDGGSATLDQAQSKALTRAG